MNITGKIKSVKKYLNTLLKDNQEFYLFINMDLITKEKLLKIGFSEELKIGEQIIPSVFGKTTDFNANGKEEVIRPKEYETHHREQEWTRKEFRGRNDSEEVTNWIDISYKKLKRKYIYPLEKSLIISNENKIISEKLVYNESNFEIILHYMKMFGEIFGECEVLNSNFETIISFDNIQKVNWEILPDGKSIDWDKMTNILKENRKKVNDKKIIDRRIDFFKKYKEDFVAIGTGGFKGYIVLGYPKQNIYMCECFYHGNATYILGKNWKSIANLTKKEIIEGNMAKERVIHDKNWEKNLIEYFK